MLREQTGGSGEGRALIPASGSNCPLRCAVGAVAASGSGSGYQQNARRQFRRFLYNCTPGLSSREKCPLQLMAAPGMILSSAGLLLFAAAGIFWRVINIYLY